MSHQITCRPVGRVCTENNRFILDIDPEFSPALEALAGFSHIQVLWWAHESDTEEGRAALTVNSPYKGSPETLGIFATRSESRPNPVMLTTAPIIHVDIKAGQVELGWLDAQDNSPIIDIKPYQPCFDRVREVQLPEWCAHWSAWQEDSGEFDWSAVFNF